MRSLCNVPAKQYLSICTEQRPLPGVNVLEKGTTNGSITDVDGKFIIDHVEKGKTLLFSYIGFTTREVVVDKNIINVTLQEDLQALDEVVVIGYGSMTRKDVTSSITTVLSVMVA